MRLDQLPERASARNQHDPSSPNPIDIDIDIAIDMAIAFDGAAARDGVQGTRRVIENSELALRIQDAPAALCAGAWHFGATASISSIRLCGTRSIRTRERQNQRRVLLRCVKTRDAHTHAYDRWCGSSGRTAGCCADTRPLDDAQQSLRHFVDTDDERIRATCAPCRYRAAAHVTKTVD